MKTGSKNGIPYLLLQQQGGSICLSTQIDHYLDLA
jgi:hypothetical protein